MSEPIPESIPTSADPRSKRPTKKRALTPRSALANDVEALFAKPDRDIHIPGSAPKRNSLAPPPEIVANVQGSSAGAGSGEFHVYKASRRREYERLRLMDEEVAREEEEKAFRERKEEMEKKDRAKTDKNRARREKARMKKAMQKKGGKGEGAAGSDGVASEGRAKKLKPNSAAPWPIGQDDSPLPDGGEVKSADEVGLVIHDDD
ncbi:DUF1168-domain-containing protein [Lindgomyces ingoldianus]|uniref:DUF1168-domain-containing protein n=1 Tax=Lindgomyces ingoldianus TaxID=673940 RepID=A0ACB6R836_9PLEO|nr:DUF1168-domain-containing protein [Lindgomyces ingoldianus]KAF2475424.1 DUF1168-domain-containing protein [Lindgomyces ingoldianus]